MNSTSSNQGFVITAFWETKPGEEDSVAGLLRQFWLGFQGLKTYSGQLTRAIAPN